MEEQQPNQLNNYLTYIRNNKYNIYFIVSITILLFIIISMIIFTINYKKTPPQKNISVNLSPTQAISPTLAYTSEAPSVAPSATTMQITTPDPTEAAQIENQVQPQITPAISYTYSNIKKFGDNWATALVTNPSVQAGGLIMKKVNGSWIIIEGPGTFFPPSLLQSDGVPQEVIDSFTPTPAP